MKEKINLRMLAVAVESIKTGRECSVIISCSDSNTKDKIKKAVENELGNV